MKTLSIVIPTYNEKENLPILIKKLQKILKEKKYEILIVDDNSPDGTGLLAKKISKKYKNIKVFIRKKKLGLSSAILFGIKKSKYKLVCIMDADLQHPPSLIPKMISTLENKKADIVIASRFAPGSKIKGLTNSRVFLSRFGIFLSKLFFPKISNIQDPFSGFFLLKKYLIKNFKLQTKGFKFLLEFLIKSNPKKIEEIPFIFEKRKRGKSKLTKKEFFEFLKLLIYLRIRLT